MSELLPTYDVPGRWQRLTTHAPSVDHRAVLIHKQNDACSYMPANVKNLNDVFHPSYAHFTNLTRRKRGESVSLRRYDGKPPYRNSFADVRVHFNLLHAEKYRFSCRNTAVTLRIHGNTSTRDLRYNVIDTLHI